MKGCWTGPLDIYAGCAGGTLTFHHPRQPWSGRLRVKWILLVSLATSCLFLFWTGRGACSSKSEMLRVARGGAGSPVYLLEASLFTQVKLLATYDKLFNPRQGEGETEHPLWRQEVLRFKQRGGCLPDTPVEVLLLVGEGSHRLGGLKVLNWHIATPYFCCCCCK